MPAEAPVMRARGRDMAVRLRRAPGQHQPRPRAFYFEPVGRGAWDELLEHLRTLAREPGLDAPGSLRGNFTLAKSVQASR